MNRNEGIPVFFACDNKFVNYTMVAIKSLIENASREYQYKIHILHTDISSERMEKVLHLSAENFNIDFVDVTEYLISVEKKLPIRDYYTSTTYYRFFISEMFEDYEKAIYLDSDMIILGDISELYNQDLGNNLIGAVPDQVILQVDTFSEYVEKVLGLDHNLYFNAGMMLINCKLFRKYNVLVRFLELLHTYHFVVAQDQDYLNIICKNRVLLLGPEWNTEVFGQIPCVEKDICIMHYNMASKPWYSMGNRMSSYFWDYASRTECYEEIKAGMGEYTESDRIRDEQTGENLIMMAISEINNENNYCNLLKKTEKQSTDRKHVLERVAQYEREGRFDEDVEEDPPAPILMPEDIDYLHRGWKGKIRTIYAEKMGRWFINLLVRKKQLLIKEIDGLRNFDALKSGAIITCNHFNAFDSFAMQITYDTTKHGRRKLYRVIREGNYTNFPGFYGFLMRNCNTLPLSSNYETMKKFMSAVDKLLKAGHYVLIYPEQSMWWNYRKPKPLKKGAYTFAAKNNVPVLPVFITIQDSSILGPDGFYVQEYTIHVSEAIYPDTNKSKAQNIEDMRNQNYQEWKRIYEDTYHMKLEYTCDLEANQ
ncbi:MAG TPA: glycosyltransferase [Lachnospiraceae bacterium]|nr:glycosyltransferase [Lachnospiraceae bacterium]